MNPASAPTPPPAPPGEPRKCPRWPQRGRGKDKDKLHRRYKVMRLPAKVQAVIFRGYADGEPYDKICADVEKMGYHLTRNAVGNYWRDIWKKEHEELQKAQTLLVVLKQALGLPRNSPSRKVAEELLYTLVFLGFPLLKKEGPLALLREAREQSKAAEKKGSGEALAPGASNPVEQAREIRRRWRRLYGLEPEDKEDQEG